MYPRNDHEDGLDHYRMAVDEQILDGIPQAATTELELDLSPQIANQQLSRALRIYTKATSRPRKAQCWAYVQTELWNARQDAIRAGALKRDSAEYVIASTCYNGATYYLGLARELERTGHADARV